MSAHAHAPVGGRLVTVPFLVLAFLAAIALALLAGRFVYGLGAVTNLNDGYPWGIWVIIDIVIGTAFGCAGYAVSLIVYILNRGEYHPIVRSAVMASLFGYTLAGIAVMFDLGRYWNFYNLFLPWYAQPNSVMWEIALCVAGYITVLWIEFAPTFLERFGLHNAREKLSRVLFIIIALGVLLPTMHQSSLGSAIVILGHKVSPLWQTQFLPLLYLSSAILMGLALVPFESVLSALGLRRQLETGLMGRLNRVILVVGAIFLAVRFGDLLFRGALGHALAGDLRANMFLLESALFIGGLALLARQQARRSARAQFIAAVTLLTAGILFRINSYLVGYEPVNGTWHYFPSVPEMLVTVGVFSIEILLYLVFVKKLPVLAKHA